MSANKKNIEAVHDLPVFWALLKQGFYGSPFIISALATKHFSRVSITTWMAQTNFDSTISKTENSLGNYSELNIFFSKGH